MVYGTKRFTEIQRSSTKKIMALNRMLHQVNDA